MAVLFILQRPIEVVHVGLQGLQEGVCLLIGDPFSSGAGDFLDAVEEFGGLDLAGAGQADRVHIFPLGFDVGQLPQLVDSL